VIPKSAQRDRIRENAQIFDFELDRRDMSAFDVLNPETETWSGIQPCSVAGYGESAATINSVSDISANLVSGARRSTFL
jgi:hypothetical protein